MAEDPADKRSRVQHRLAQSKAGDRALLKILRRKRQQSSRLGNRLRATRYRKRWIRGSLLTVSISLILGSTLWVALFVEGKVTYRGVPYSVIDKFWQDKAAKTAYFSGDKQALHDRLATLGVERDIKAFYRNQFESEHELDRHIHQIMFDRTGYVGEAYKVDRHGRLISR